MSSGRALAEWVVMVAASHSDRVTVKGSEGDESVAVSVCPANGAG